MHTETSTPVTPPQPVAGGELTNWMLDPDLTFLNHGCFGARPRVVHEARIDWLRQFETQPIGCLERDRDVLLDNAKADVGAFLGMRPSDFGFVTNATGGVNAVLRSLEFERGDEILTTNHVYNAVRQTMRWVSERTGAVAIEVPVDPPFETPQGIADAVMSGVTDRTRLVVIDHVSSSPAIVFPAAEIVERCAQRGIDVLIDGAHAPGMLPLDVADVGAAYYTGNLHKWVCAPNGAAFLWVREDRREMVHPTTISHFLGEGMANEFAWQGTRDITPWLTTRDALAFMGGLGWDAVMRHNRSMIRWVRSMLADRVGLEALGPEDGALNGSMVTVRLPDRAHDRFEDIHAAHRAFVGLYKVEVPVIDWNDAWWIRLSCQVYNTPDDYHRFAEVIEDLGWQS